MITASGATSYQWTPSFSGMCQDAECSIILVALSQTTTFSVLGTNASLCPDTAQITITVLPQDSITVTPSTLCQGDSIFFNGDFIYNEGTFCMTETLTGGCTISECIDVSFIATDSVDIIPNEVFISKGDSVQLIISDNYVTYQWGDPTLSCLDCPNPFASPIESTTYFVTVTDENGCEIVGRSNVLLTDQCQDGALQIPDAFSPNSNGYNDRFRVAQLSPNVSNVTIEVFNRWGQRVFYENGNLGWDGRDINFNPAPEETYLYIISTTCIDGVYAILQRKCYTDQMIRQAFHIILITLLVGWSQWLIGQNIHFAQYDFAPTFFNASDMDLQKKRTIDYGIIYRDQAFTVSSESYKTFAGTMVYKGDSWGISGGILHDRTGKGPLISNQFFLGGAYDILPGKTHTLSIGGQVGFVQRKFGNFDNFTFEEDILGSGNIEFADFQNINYIDYSTGLTYHLDLDDNKSIKIGSALQNIGQNDAVSGSLEKYRRRLVSYIHYTHPLSDRWLIQPRIFNQYKSIANELSIQTKFSYLTNRYGDTWLTTTVGWRALDALQFMVGIEKPSWKAGLAYEYNTSSLQDATGAAAALELAFAYRYHRKEKQEEEIIPEVFKITLHTEVEGPGSQDSVQLTLITPLDSTTRDFTGETIKDTIASNATYTLIATRDGFLSDTLSFHLLDIKNDTTIYRILAIKPLPDPVIESALGTIVEEPIVIDSDIEDSLTTIIRKDEAIRLEHINYDFDDATILGQSEPQLTALYNVLVQYPDIVIELSSHTDIHGSDDYNMRLSQRRADASKSWLVNKGIVSSRIISKGYGETQLHNHCKEGIPCSETLHRENRRTEFKLIEGPDYIKIVPW